MGSRRMFTALDTGCLFLFKFELVTDWSDSRPVSSVNFTNAQMRYIICELCEFDERMNEKMIFVFLCFRLCRRSYNHGAWSKVFCVHLF